MPGKTEINGKQVSCIESTAAQDDDSCLISISSLVDTIGLKDGQTIEVRKEAQDNRSNTILYGTAQAFFDLRESSPSL